MGKKRVQKIQPEDLEGRSDKHGARPQAHRLEGAVKNVGIKPKKKKKLDQ